MTIKAKRAKALRKMDHDEAMSYIMGGIVDESFDADAVHKALAPVEIDLAAFDQFFGRRLGRYRSISESERPTVADELRLIDETVDLIQQLRLRLEHLPPDTGAHIYLACWKRHGESFHERRRRLDAELNEVFNLLVLSEREFDPYKGNAGAKGKTDRDWLLHDVAHWLEDQGLGKGGAAGVAADALRAVGVDAPTDPKDARSIVLRLERQE